VTVADRPDVPEVPRSPGAPDPDRLPEELFAGELRVMNAHLPRSQKTLADLLEAPEPFVACRDDTPHLFKIEELRLLAEFLTPEEKRSLYLPMMIEVGAGPQGESLLRCRGTVEEKVVSRVLRMPVECRQGGITLYRPQLASLRNVLVTSTQYVFVVRAGAGGEEE
jgi:uncharacterized protein (UPF0216 family)